MTESVQGAESSDRDLLHRHLAGDPHAFSILVRRHQDRMWAVALRTVGNRDDAADAIQEAMVKAFRSADRFRGDSAVTTWLHRIVVNACLDLIRRNKARPSVPLEVDGHAGSLADDTGPDPAIQREQRVDVVAALQQLPEDQRAAIVLVDMEGYPVSDVAQMLDCATGTVKSRCARGRTRLAQELSPWRNQSDDESVSSPTARPSTGPIAGGDKHDR